MAAITPPCDSLDLTAEVVLCIHPFPVFIFVSQRVLVKVLRVVFLVAGSTVVVEPIPCTAFLSVTVDVSSGLAILRDCPYILAQTMRRGGK
jgi:hypothetical protein